MEHQKVKSSSNVASVGFEDGILEVTFHSGNTHQYQADADIHAALMKAKSIGGFVHQTLKKLPNRRKGEEKWQNSSPASKRTSTTTRR